MTRDDGRVSKEVLPDPEPLLAILGLDLLAVAHPVSVPVPESSGVVNTMGIDGLDFETSAFELIDEPAERSGSVSTWEDVLVHEKTPVAAVSKLIMDKRMGNEIKTYQMRSSNCQDFLKPAIWRKKIPSSSSMS